MTVKELFHSACAQVENTIDSGTHANEQVTLDHGAVEGAVNHGVAMIFAWGSAATAVMEALRNSGLGPDHPEAKRIRMQ